MSEIIGFNKQIVLIVANLCNINFLGKYICAHGFDLFTRYIMSIIVSNCQHCDEQQFQPLMCTVMCTVMSLHDFHCSKARFIHMSTVTGSHTCSGKLRTFF